MIFFLSLFIILPAILADTVSVSLPLASQNPSSARAGAAYTFTLARNTFTTDSPYLSYSATNLPTWLTFDSTHLCFYGTAPSSDTPARSIHLTATTEDGHSASDSFSLTVETSQGVNLINPLGDQFRSGSAEINSAYSLLPLSSLFPGVRVPPGWSFSLGFIPVFSANNKRKVYYTATQPNGTALPDWLRFTESTLTFDGIAPSPTQLERRGSNGVFNVRLWGSDIRGYMDQYQDFTIRVAARTIEQIRPLTLNLTAGYPLSESIDFFSAFKISGRQLTKADLAALDTDSKSYTINLDNSTINGNPPAEYGGRTETVYMTLESLDGDTLNSTMSITYYGSFFTGNKLGPVHVLPGDRMLVPLAPYLSNKTTNYDITATFDPPEAGRWMSLDQTHMMVSGDVPSEAGLHNITVRLNATDKDHNTHSYANLLISLSEEAPAEIKAEKSGLSGGVIGGIVIGVLLNVVLVMVFLWMWLRRRQKRKEGVTGDVAEGYEDEAPQDPERFAAGPIYRADSFDEVPNENDQGDGEHPEQVTPGNEKAEGAGKIGPGWHKRASTVPASILTALHLPGSPVFSNPNPNSSTPKSQITRHTDSPGSIASAASKARKFLANPFTATKARQIPVISNPVLHPSFSNAAFQASLAIAVDSKGIVSRGGTYEGAPTTTTISDFTPSGTFTGTQAYGASTCFTNGYTTSGAPETDETDMDRPTSEYTARYTTTDITGSEGFEIGREAVGGSAAGDSSVVGKRSSGGSGESGGEWTGKESDRASWESGAPFVWNTEVGGGTGEVEIDETIEEGEEDYEESRRGSTQAPTTEYGWTEEGGMTEETFDSDPPIQRSDFRPRTENSTPTGSPGSGSSAYDDRTSTDQGSSVRGTIRHEVVTPLQDNELEAADFSIDNIHFPTESDIARTEASSDPSELDPCNAVIATASRISARHTLDSPMSISGGGFADSPGSDYTERMPHSPVVGPAQSRLVDLGKQRQVVVRPMSSGRREASQTAVVDSESETGTRVSYYEYPEYDIEEENNPVSTQDIGSPGSGESGGTGETTPQARPRRMSVVRNSAYTGVIPDMPSRTSIKSTGSRKGKHRANKSSLSLNNHISRSRSPTPPMPESFPSLPALPTGHSLSSAKSSKSVRSIIPPSSNRSSTSSTTRLPPQTRVLLGVNEPFHFYPPLLIASPSGMSTTTAYTLNTTYTSVDGKPLTPPGARYVVYEEKRGKGGDVVKLREMPDWLHWEDMELWGVPGEEIKGRWDVRIVELLEGKERVVGRFALEVVGR